MLCLPGVRCWTDSPSPSGYQLPIGPQIHKDLHACLPTRHWDFSWLGLESCACYRNRCEFTYTAALLFTMNGPLYPPTTAGSYILPSPSSATIPAPWEARRVMQCASLSIICRRATPLGWSGRCTDWWLQGAVIRTWFNQVSHQKSYSSWVSARA